MSDLLAFILGSVLVFFIAVWYMKDGDDDAL